MLKKIVFISILLKFSTALCPSEQVVNPCVCKDDSVACINISTEFNLKTLFENINKNVPNGQKNWGSFYLERTNVKELPANVFGEITFESVVLFHNPSLTYIHPLAFTRSSFRLKRFIVENTSLSNSGDKERDIFDALSRCPDLESIRLVQTNLTSIPDHAFQPINGEFTKLNYLVTDDSPIKSIGEFAFYHMPNLIQLGMTRNKFTQIKKNTFTIKEHSNNKSEIFLQGVPLTDDSFDALSLIRIRRPLWIRLFENKLTTLHESVFAPFLELNQYNMIDLSGNNIQCDCRIKWIINEKGYYSTGKIAGTNISSCQLNNC